MDRDEEITHNGKVYKQEYFWGKLDDAVRLLWDYRKAGILAYIYFNEHYLYSDEVTMDGAYMECTGKTKAEFDEDQRKWREEYRRHKEEHEAAIPQLTEEWVAKGHEILDSKYWEQWDKIVPIRLGDLYEGMELGDTLEIVEHLNSGGSFEDADRIMRDEQDHSGMSASLVIAMVSEFCDRGKEFEEYIRR